MPDKRVLNVAEDIRRLRIQGASKILKAAINAVSESAQHGKAKNIGQFRKQLKENVVALAKARPTEPGLRNALKIILTHSVHEDSLEKAKWLVMEECAKARDRSEDARRLIAKNGAEMMQRDSVVFTHCHSNTIEAMLEKAWRDKKISEVICTETRPRYQGRLTAENLSLFGIPVTMIVDSAAATFIKKADYFFSGADSVTADGSVINKVGTRGISLAAKKAGVPHYVVTSSYKFDAETLDKETEIEERDSDEVWKERPKKLRIANPAFDVTEAGLIEGIIYEKGVLAPHLFAIEMFRETGLEKRKTISLLSLLKNRK